MVYVDLLFRAWVTLKCVRLLEHRIMHSYGIVLIKNVKLSTLQRDSPLLVSNQINSIHSLDRSIKFRWISIIHIESNLIPRLVIINQTDQTRIYTNDLLRCETIGSRLSESESRGRNYFFSEPMIVISFDRLTKLSKKADWVYGLYVFELKKFELYWFVFRSNHMSKMNLN